MTDLRKIDLNLLVVFETIYSCGNISHAAKKLGLTQPTISNSLARLRETLDDRLFLRANQGVEPTSKASQMIGSVRQALQMIENQVTNNGIFDPSVSKRHFKLLLLDQLESVLIPPLIRLVQNSKTITFEALPISTTPALNSLSSGSADLALTTYISGLDELECEVVGTAGVVVIARQGHPEIGEELTMDNFRTIGHMALPYAMRTLSRVDEALRHLKIERHIVYTAAKFWSFPHIISTTNLISLMPGDLASIAAKMYPIKIYPVPFDLPEQQVYMSWVKSNSADPAHIWLRNQISTAYKQRLLNGLV